MVDERKRKGANHPLSAVGEWGPNTGKGGGEGGTNGLLLGHDLGTSPFVLKFATGFPGFPLGQQGSPQCLNNLGVSLRSGERLEVWKGEKSDNQRRPSIRLVPLPVHTGSHKP